MSTALFSSYALFFLLFVGITWIKPTFSASAAEKIIGTSCKTGQNAADWDTIAQCSATTHTFVRAPYWFGAAVEPCDAAHNGLMQWTGSSLLFCQGSSGWASPSTGGMGSSASAASPARSSSEMGTGLFSPATGVIAFSSLGTEALRVNSLAQVGVGIAAPAVKMDINGGLRPGSVGTCTSALAGTLQWASGHLQICTGNNWATLK